MGPARPQERRSILFGRCAWKFWGTIIIFFCVLSLQVWDLRALKSAGASRTADAPGNGRGPIRLRGDGGGGGGGGVSVTAIAVFDYHKAAITRLMWHWHDASTFLAASRSFFLLFVF